MWAGLGLGLGMDDQSGLERLQEQAERSARGGSQGWTGGLAAPPLAYSTSGSGSGAPENGGYNYEGEGAWGR